MSDEFPSSTSRRCGRSTTRSPTAAVVGLWAVLMLLATGCVTELEADATAGLTSTTRIPVTTTVESPAADQKAEGSGPDSATTTTTPLPALVDAHLEVVEVLDGLDAPVALSFRSGQDEMIFVAQREGTVRRVEIRARSRGRISYRLRSGHLVDVRDEIDLSPGSTDDDDDDGETSLTMADRGVRGMAISADGRRIYLSFTDTNGTTRIDEWTFGDAQISNRTRRTVLQLDTPLSDVAGNNLAFGPDGFLYIALGVADSGATSGTAQDPRTLAGSVLRIDPEPFEDEDYVIPAGNPFADGDLGAPEVYLYGLHHPTALSWDRATDDLWLTDAGRDRIEEINLLTAGADVGANLGWDVYEGSRLADPDLAALADHTPPLFEYDQGVLCKLTGGTVYRGEIEPLQGVYVYGDACDQRLYGMVTNQLGEVVEAGPIAEGLEAGPITALAANAKNELYGLSLRHGSILSVQAIESTEDEEDE